jgi:hypothetical protein
MNLAVALLQVYTPRALRRSKLEALFALTADAFGCQPPAPDGLSDADYLHAYATFTRTKVEDAVHRASDMQALADRLYERAYLFGSNLRQQLRVRSDADVMATARALYRGIGIDFHGAPDGAITITQCFFSRYYTSQVCQVVSALDSGVLAGLAGGGHLTFLQRITDGNDRCLACFSRTELRPCTTNQQ